MRDTPRQQLLCSTGAFSHWPVHENQAALACGSLLAVDGFELMFDPDCYAHLEQAAGDLQRSPLAFPVVHADKRLGSALGMEPPAACRLLEANCRLAALVGAQLLVLHLWGGPELDSNLERNLAQLRMCLEIAERYGIALAIETLPCRRADPVSNVLAALERDPRCWVALDTEFLANHQQLEEVFTADRLWSQGRVCHVHIKDADGELRTPDGRRRYLQPGEGRIDFPAFLGMWGGSGSASNGAGIPPAS